MELYLAKVKFSNGERRRECFVLNDITIQAATQLDCYIDIVIPESKSGEDVAEHRLVKAQSVVYARGYYEGCSYDLILASYNDGMILEHRVLNQIIPFIDDGTSREKLGFSVEEDSSDYILLMSNENAQILLSKYKEGESFAEPDGYMKMYHKRVDDE